MIRNILLVGVGGGAGSVLRYVVGLLAARAAGTGFPLGTLVVNVVGCLAGGVLLARLAPQPADHPARLLLGVGLLGGFTTFSAFGVETVALMQRGSALGAGANVAANLTLGLLGAWAGWALAR